MTMHILDIHSQRRMIFVICIFANMHSHAFHKYAYFLEYAYLVQVVTALSDIIFPKYA